MNAKDKLFIVDLTSVSFFDSEKLKNIASSEEYKKCLFFI